MTSTELADSLQRLDQGLSAYVHDVALEAGEFVVYLRKPTLSEKLIMAFMPKRMERERMAVTVSVIRQVADRIGVDGARLVQNIVNGRGTKISRELHDAVVNVNLHDRSHEDLV